MGAYYWSPGMTVKSMEEVFVAEAIHFYNKDEQSAANSLGITLMQLQDIVRRSQASVTAQAKADVERKKKADEFLARSRGVIGVDKQGHDTLSPYVPAEGVDASVAVLTLAQTAVPSLMTPENAIPTAAVLPTTPVVNDPVAAAKRTQVLIQENLPTEHVTPADTNFPEEK